MDTLSHDIRFGLRLLVKDWSLALAVVAVLALAIAGNLIAFGVVNELVLGAVPYPEPDRLVQLWEVNPATGDRSSTISPFNFLDWKEQAGSFQAMAAYAYQNVTLVESNGPVPLTGARISQDFFQVFEVDALLGRLPPPEELDSGVAILSHDAWQTHFGGDASVLGAKAVLNGQPYTVVAVMPSRFSFPWKSVDVWIPPAFEVEGKDRGDHFLFGVGRLKPDASLPSAQGEMSAIAKALAERHPDFNEGSGIRLVELRQEVIGDRAQNLLLLQGAMLLFLLMACANVANLLLTRAVERQKEISVRLAMGASRRHIVRQLLVESCLLALLSGGAGALLAWWGSYLVGSDGALRLIASDRLALDPSLLAFTFFVTLSTALLCGLAPALHASRGNHFPLIKLSGRLTRGSGRQRLSAVLVALQVGVAAMLLVSSLLVLRSLDLLRRVEVGFDPEGLVTMRLRLPSSEYPSPWATFGQVAERLRSMPEIAGVAGVNDLPFSGSRTQTTFHIVGRPAKPGEVRNADYRTVMGDYFEVMDLAQLNGRTFGPQDDPQSAAVAIVNQVFADRYLEGEDPVGMFLSVRGTLTRVVGVVESLKHQSLTGGEAPEVYVPFSQGKPPNWAFLVLRTNRDIESLAPMLRSAVRQVIPTHPIYNLRTMEQRLSGSITPQRRTGWLLATAAALALIISLVGTYAAISYGLKQRRREVAVRIALGAGRWDVVRLIVLSALIPCALGIVGGLAGALATGRFLQSVLFGVRPAEPWAFLLVAILLLVASLIACLPTARRAASLDPQAALRDA